MSSTPKSEIYFDNAATSFPKPPTVEQALVDYIRNVGASAGRGAYPRAQRSGEIIEDTRKLLAQLFNIPTPRRIIFTLNASDALNLAIKGISWKAGDSAVVSAMEHNSVLRPLNALKKKIGIRIIKVPANAEGWVDPEGYARAIDATTKLVALVHASNVCGTIQDIARVGAMARSKNIPFLVDAAQTAGALPIDVEAMNIDLLAFPGHKALLGPLGTGALCIRDGLALEPLREGGTGSVSEEETQPDFLPDKYEPGSHNALGLAGLKAGLEFILKEGVSKIRAHEEMLTAQFLNGAQNIPGLTVYGPIDASCRVAVLPIRLEGFTPLELSQRLYAEGGLMTRSGLHCAPGAHQAIGTYSQGTTRFSFGYFNKISELEYALQSLGQLTKKPVFNQ
jgi:cysteine desulfurase family protein